MAPVYVIMFGTGLHAHRLGGDDDEEEEAKTIMDLNDADDADEKWGGRRRRRRGEGEQENESESYDDDDCEDNSDARLAAHAYADDAHRGGSLFANVFGIPAK